MSEVGLGLVAGDNDLIASASQYRNRHVLAALRDNFVATKELSALLRSAFNGR